MNSKSIHDIRGIYALCDNSQSPSRSHLELARGFLMGGIRIIQLRMKDEKDLSRVRDTALTILDLKSRHDFCFILNDRVELAAELLVDGVHLGQDDMSLSEARTLLGPGKLIGYSSHSLPEAIEAENSGADYVALGAIYPTTSKGPGHPVVGCGLLREVVARLKVPVVAIGGIGLAQIPELRQTGVAAAAMISALTRAPDIGVAARALVRAWEAARL